MNDRNIMESILLTTKGACDLYMHGAIESATPNVHQAFTTALNDTLSMQSKIYQQMEQKGWYASDVAPKQKIDQVKQKFTSHLSD